MNELAFIGLVVILLAWRKKGNIGRPPVDEPGFFLYKEPIENRVEAVLAVVKAVEE